MELDGINPAQTPPPPPPFGMHTENSGKPHTEQEDSEVDPGKTNKERITTDHLSSPATWNTPACSKSPEKRLLKKTRGKEGRRKGERKGGRGREGRMGFLIILRAVSLSFEESPKY